MKIDITREPPADIFQNRDKYIRIAGAFLALSIGGVLLVAYAVLSDTQQSETMETIALALIVAPALPFFYFGEKVQAYKKLSEAQTKELADLGRQHPEIKDYCELVAQAGRPPIMAELEACQAWVEETSRPTRPKG